MKLCRTGWSARIWLIGSGSDFMMKYAFLKFSGGAIGLFPGGLSAALPEPSSDSAIWFDSDAIIDRRPNPLLAAKVSLDMVWAMSYIRG